MNKSDDLFFASALEAARRIRAGELDAAELLERLIARIKTHDAHLNAIVVRDLERARVAARALTAERPRADRPLHGVPMTVKESFDVAGLPTTWGLPELRDNIAAADAHVVRALKAAGAVIAGKTNVPAWLGDFQSYNEIYGVTKNPWDLARSPGGSSGGGAAAVAAGLSFLEYGSDIGGSLRIPAHFCGIYAHKPTFGIVPAVGHALPGREAGGDLSVLGPLARFPEDLAIALTLTIDAAQKTAGGWQLRLPPAKRDRIVDYRVALWLDDSICPVDDEILARIREVGAIAERCGAPVTENARPNFDAQRYHDVYMLMLRAITGARRPPPFLEESREIVRTLDPEDRSQRAYAARGALLSYRNWLQHNDERTRFRKAWSAFFEKYDVVLAPIASTTAFFHDHEPDRDKRWLNVGGTKIPYGSQLFWSGLPVLSYLPATAAPIGLSREGLPIGMQVIGREFSDYETIRFAELLQKEIGGFTPPPKFT